MAQTLTKLVDLVPSAAPSDEELFAWAELPPDERLRRLRARLSAADCGTVTEATFGDILSEARVRADARRG